MTKEEKYVDLLPQVKALCEGEEDIIAKMANVCALLHREFGFWWTGFYRVKPHPLPLSFQERGVDSADSPSLERRGGQGGEAELILGPFQGPLACMHIGYGKGVCGTAWKERRTVVVPDVEQFPGHIACSSESRSEIVVPVFAKSNNQALRQSENQEVIAVLDIDSRELATFDEVDARWLEQMAACLATR